MGGRFVPVSLEKPRFEKLVNGTLVIRNASDEDDGTYLCTAANGVSDVVVNRQVQLKVHGMKLLVFFLGNKIERVNTSILKQRNSMTLLSSPCQILNE